LPFVAGPADERSVFQFSIKSLFGFVFFVALFLTCVREFGFMPMGSIVLLSALGGLGAAVFRRAFVNATVIGGAMLLFASLTITGIHDSRGAARRNQRADNLRHLSTAYQVANDFRMPSQTTLSPSNRRKVPATQRSMSPNAHRETN